MSALQDRKNAAARLDAETRNLGCPFMCNTPLGQAWIAGFLAALRANKQEAQ